MSEPHENKASIIEDYPEGIARVPRNKEEQAAFCEKANGYAKKYAKDNEQRNTTPEEEKKNPLQTYFGHMVLGANKLKNNQEIEKLKIQENKDNKRDCVYSKLVIVSGKQSLNFPVTKKDEISKKSKKLLANEVCDGLLKKPVPPFKLNALFVEYLRQYSNQAALTGFITLYRGSVLSHYFCNGKYGRFFGVTGSECSLDLTIDIISDKNIKIKIKESGYTDKEKKKPKYKDDTTFVLDLKIPEDKSDLSVSDIDVTLESYNFNIEGRKGKKLLDKVIKFEQKFINSTDEGRKNLIDNNIGDIELQGFIENLIIDKKFDLISFFQDKPDETILPDNAILFMERKISDNVKKAAAAKIICSNLSFWSKTEFFYTLCESKKVSNAVKLGVAKQLIKANSKDEKMVCQFVLALSDKKRITDDLIKNIAVYLVCYSNIKQVTKINFICNLCVKAGVSENCKAEVVRQFIISEGIEFSVKIEFIGTILNDIKFNNDVKNKSVKTLMEANTVSATEKINFSDALLKNDDINVDIKNEAVKALMETYTVSTTEKIKFASDLLKNNKINVDIKNSAVAALISHHDDLENKTTIKEKIDFLNTSIEEGLVLLEKVLPLMLNAKISLENCLKIPLDEQNKNIWYNDLLTFAGENPRVVTRLLLSKSKDADNITNKIKFSTHLYQEKSGRDFLSKEVLKLALKNNPVFNGAIIPLKLLLNKRISFDDCLKIHFVESEKEKVWRKDLFNFALDNPAIVKPQAVADWVQELGDSFDNPIKHKPTFFSPRLMKKRYNAFKEIEKLMKVTTSVKIPSINKVVVGLAPPESKTGSSGEEVLENVSNTYNTASKIEKENKNFLVIFRHWFEDWLSRWSGVPLEKNKTDENLNLRKDVK